LFEQWRASAFSEGPLTSLAVALTFLVAAVIFEVATRRDPRRYFSRNARTDALYMLFYLGGSMGCWSLSLSCRRCAA
jgi:hypothetical protein